MRWEIRQGDCLDLLRAMPDESVQTCVTSPPYWGLRDYGHDGQLGLEETPEQYVENMVAVFREVRRVLRDDGTLWLNLGDSYTSGGRDGHGTRVGYKQQTNRGMNGDRDPVRAPQPPGLKPKDLVGIPWMVAFALRADGWYLRSDIIWAKPNPMPESVTDRPTKAHEYLFLLTKGLRYYYDAEAIRERAECDRMRGPAHHPDPISTNGNSGLAHRPLTGHRNKRSVWTVTTQPFSGAHFATFPPKLIEPCILAGSAEGDTVLDPFAGAATTGVVACRHNRSFVGLELNPEYVELGRNRIRDDAPLLNVPAEQTTQKEAADQEGLSIEEVLAGV